MRPPSLLGLSSLRDPRKSLLPAYHPPFAGLSTEEGKCRSNDFKNRCCDTSLFYVSYAIFTRTKPLAGAVIPSAVLSFCSKISPIFSGV